MRERCARSAARTSRPSSSPRPIGSLASSARRASPFSRTSTACSSAATTTTVLPLCRELGVSYIPYFPLASGLLTGKYRRGEPAPEGTRLAGREIEDERFERVEACAAFAEESRPLAARARDLRAGVDAGRRVDHRRGDEARAGAGERCRSGCVLAALRRRASTRSRSSNNRGRRTPYSPHADRSRDRSITRAEGIPPNVVRRESDDGQAWIRRRARRGSPRARSPSPGLPSRQDRQPETQATRDHRACLRASRGHAQALRARIGAIQATQERIRAKIAERRAPPGAGGACEGTRFASSKRCSRSSWRSSLECWPLYEEKLHPAEPGHVAVDADTGRPAGRPVLSRLIAISSARRTTTGMNETI